MSDLRRSAQTLHGVVFLNIFQKQTYSILSIDTSILYTTNGAKLVEYENSAGRLVAGAPADFIILETTVDSLENESHILNSVKVNSTFVAGNCVYKSSN